jgi:hypothetical protein
LIYPRPRDFDHPGNGGDLASAERDARSSADQNVGRVRPMLAAMTTLFRRPLGRAVALAPLVLAATAAAPAAAAPGTGFLSWGSVQLRTGQTARCYATALDLLKKDGFTSVARHTSEVVGNYRGTYATITCIRTVPTATAVVMVVGLHQGRTAEVRDLLVGQLGGKASAPSS